MKEYICAGCSIPFECENDKEYDEALHCCKSCNDKLTNSYLVWEVDEY